MRIFAVACMAVIVLLCPLAGWAECDTQLVLANDVSSSMSAERFDIQRQGYAKALTDPNVVLAMTSGERRCTEVSLMDWADSNRQSVSVPWTAISGAPDAAKVAGLILAAPRPFVGTTGVAGAITKASTLFTCSACRRVIDVSGDGRDNNGPASSTKAAAIQAEARGIVINGLAILHDEPDLEAWYRDNVQTETGFVMVAQDMTAFAGAMRRKLELEVAWKPIVAPPRFMLTQSASSPCGPLKKVVDGLSKLGEAITGGGVFWNGTLRFALFTANDGSSWTFAAVRPDGVACLVASGKSWETVPWVAPGDPS